MVMRRVRAAKKAAKKAAKELIDKANLRSGLTVTKPGPATTRRVMKRGRNVNVAAGGAGAAGLAAAAASGKDSDKKKATTKRRTAKNETKSQAAERIRRQKEDFERKKRSRKQADDAAASVKKTRELAKQAAKDPKAQKTPAPGKTPTSTVKAPRADKMDTKTKVTKPKPTSKVKVDSPKLTKVTKRPKVTGKGGRDVVSKGPMGDRRLANVTREQLKAAGLTTGPQGLRKYLNKFNELGRRPKPADFKTEKKTSKVIGSPASGKNRRPGGKAMGGMMKSKMSSKGGAKGGKKIPPGMMGGGMMKSKMSAKGGAKGGKKIPPGMKVGGMANKKFPDLTGDGKVTQKDILKGRGVPGFKKGGAMTKKGYAKGGMAKKGYAKGGAAMKAKGGKKGGVRRSKPRGVGVALRGFGKALR